MLVDAALNALILAEAYNVSLFEEEEAIQDIDKEVTLTEKSAKVTDTVPDTDLENVEIDEIKRALESLFKKEVSVEEISNLPCMEIVKIKVIESKSSIISRTGMLWLQYMDMIDLLKWTYTLHKSYFYR